MASRVLERLRSRIRANRYVFTWHSTDELEEDGLLPSDATNIILTGTIVAVQRDASQERKYVIQGLCLAGTDGCEVVKLSPTDKVVFVSAWLGTPHDHL